MSLQSFFAVFFVSVPLLLILFLFAWRSIDLARARFRRAVAGAPEPGRTGMRRRGVWSWRAAAA